MTKSETIEKCLESGLEYYSPNIYNIVTMNYPLKQGLNLLKIL